MRPQLLLALACVFPGSNLPLRSQTLPPADRRADVVQDLNTPRTFPRIESRSEWEARALAARENILVSCGLWPPPEKTPLDAHVFGKVEREGYSVEKVYIQ